MGRIHEHILLIKYQKLVLEQLRYDAGSKEYIEIQLKINEIQEELENGK